MTGNGHGWEARYRQALLGQQEVSKVALADGRLVEVKDIYVHRTLLHEVVQKEPEREITVKLPVELWSKLQDKRVVLVDGPAGIGKSTLTKHLVRESETYHLIPIWIPFRLFVASGLSLAEYLDQRYIPWLELSDVRVPDRTDESGLGRSLGQWCYDQWQSGLGVLILDGLDEVFRHEERVAALKALPITGADRTRPATILTSRPLSQSLPLQREKVEVQGLTPSDQGEFIKQYRSSLQLTDEQITRFTSATQKQGRLHSLLTRPGHLIQILTTYATTNTLLDTETAVLEQLLQSRLSITGRIELPVKGEAEKKRQVLMSLAFHLLACRQGQPQTRAQLLALIQQVLWEHATHHAPLFPLTQATALLHDCVRNSGLLTEVEPEIYEFETAIWLQHLAGSAIADEQTRTVIGLTESYVLDFLDKKAWDPEWEPVLKSWVGNIENPFALFTCLMDKQNDDLARHRLGLAGRCLAEVQADLHQHSHYQGLIEQIPTESFAVWEANAERNSAELVTTLLGRAWIETEVGQAKLLALIQNPRSSTHTSMSVLIRSLGAAIPVSVQEALLPWVWDSNEAVCWDACLAFWALGPAMAISVQQVLVERLADLDVSVRIGAIAALKGLSAAMPDFVQQALVARLADWDVSVRGITAGVFRSMDVAMPSSLQRAILERLVDPDRVVRKAGAEALSDLGKAMTGAGQQALLERLEDSDISVRITAVGALGGLGTAMPRSVQQALVVQLADSDRFMRFSSVHALRELGTAMPGYVQQALVERLVDLDRVVHVAAVGALGKLGTAMPGAVQRALVAQLADLDSAVRGEAAKALGELGAAMPSAVQRALIERLADLDASVREAAVKGLGGVGAAMPVAVQRALVAQLADLDSAVRGEAAKALGELGTAMPGAVQQALVERLADSNKEVRWWAAWALEKLGVAMLIAVQQALIERLADLDASVRKAAVKGLGGFGAAMPVAVQQALIAQLADPDENVCEASAKALSSAQLQGLRLFLRGSAMGESRLVSELSATAPFADLCHDGIVHSPTALAISAPHRLPLTVV